MKFTPGPWRVVPLGSTGKLAVVAGATAICTLDANGLSEQKEANATLIAAAPDLLKAAQLMLDHYNDLDKSNRGFLGKLCLQDYALLNEALIKLPAAVAKALGEAK